MANKYKLVKIVKVKKNIKKYVMEPVQLRRSSRIRNMLRKNNEQEELVHCLTEKEVKCLKNKVKDKNLDVKKRKQKKNAKESVNTVLRKKVNNKRLGTKRKKVKRIAKRDLVQACECSDCDSNTSERDLGQGCECSACERDLEQRCKCSDCDSNTSERGLGQRCECSGCESNNSDDEDGAKRVLVTEWMSRNPCFKSSSSTVVQDEPSNTSMNSFLVNPNEEFLRHLVDSCASASTIGCPNAATRGNAEFSGCTSPRLDSVECNNDLLSATLPSTNKCNCRNTRNNCNIM
uniref:Uncharacterized protein n=1 Tax=Clastoptera arizonana TaxID=38151 RepID=A0A1B6D220_9HEMI